MTRLFIIGNGFDRAHGLPTSYKDNLKPILKEENLELFNLINKLYFVFDKNEQDYWSEFEKYLGKISEEERKLLIQFFENQIELYFQELPSIDEYSFSSDDDKFGDSFTARQYAISEVEELSPSFDNFLLNNIDKIKDFISVGFNIMIDQANEYLNSGEAQKKESINFNSDDLFINFNYTNTLESLYGIDSKNILYIHGNRNKQLIWGNEQNVIDDLNDIIKQDISKIDINNPNDPFKHNILDHIRSQVNNGKLRHSEAAEAIVYYEEVLEDESYMSYYENSAVSDEDLRRVGTSISNLSCSMVKEPQLNHLYKWIEDHAISESYLKEITVYGHSIGKVDKIYFEKIDSLLNPYLWEISYHDKSDVVLENLCQLSFKNKIEPFVF
ncbi:AbiH family protein [Enterococcus mundtii]|uniref:Bacteriophage abortive infection AbiH n=1 Tax=Enterococcus mundtii TaxID=53346 RepID=A0A1V2UCW2_ENTMU|nr:AbiH family protein [Enterococcus mundtii]ONN40944.1 hypothetical protein BTN92_13920 [Enterococcus mundtii]